MKKFLAFLSISLLAFQSIVSGSEKSIQLYDLTVEHLKNPIQLDIRNPRLSWKIRSSKKHSLENIEQRSYRVLVASSLDILAQNTGDLWDSKQVTSSNSILVSYKGEALRSRQTCYWKVQITDSKGRNSGWSDPVFWEMALLQPDDWSGSEWIGLKDQVREHDYAARKHNAYEGVHRSHPSPLIRKEVLIEKPVRRARAYVSGIGYSELFINGKKVSDHVLDPGQSNYNEHTLYVVHDITNAFEVGKNSLGFWLGNGFYGQNIAWAQGFGYGKPSVKAKIIVEYEDGSTDEIDTDTTWKATLSPIVFDNIYWGESYDAREEIQDWSEVDFDDSDWQSVVLVEPPCSDDKLRPQLIQPIKVIERIKPVEIRKTGEETYIVDFGKNIAGWIELSVNQNRGDVIHLFPTEALTKDGQKAGRFSDLDAPGSFYELYYICKGSGQESWHPRFSYTGFQFVEIHGLKSAPTIETIEALVIRSAIDKTGSFECSNEQLNAYYEASMLSLEGNWHSIPEDCPQREKCGWLGDAHATADLSFYNYDIVRLYSKYLRDIEDSLTLDERGQKIIPETAGVPPMVAPGKRANSVGTIDWAVAYLIVPWQMYLHTGDSNAFSAHFDHIKDFITYFRSFQNESGVIENGLGDWCPPKWDRKTAPEFMECHPFVSGTIFYYQALGIVSQMAELLGDSDYSKWCIKEAEAVNRSFDHVYLKTIEGTDLKYYGSQTATVMALRHGMVKQADIQARMAALEYDIKKQHNSHHSCGIHGQRFLYTVLSDYGANELVNHMLNDTSFPSPGFVLKQGLTTWPERRWNWEEVPYARSLNHPMNGGFTAFMHESLGGIRPNVSNPGYKHFILKPQMTDEVDWVKVSMESPYGQIRSEWKHEADGFIWEVEIPANTSANILIPVVDGNTLMINDREASDDLTWVTESGRLWLELEVGSGIYQFKIK